MSEVQDSVLALIGNTPIVRVQCFDTGPCDLLLKLENQNPGGSIKDRIGLSMIEAAEREGNLKPGGTIIEATAGNTGLGLALVAARKHYKLILVIPDKMSQEKLQHLRALGAQIIITRSDVGKGHPQYYQDLAEKVQKENPGSFYVNQFANKWNVHAHETTTGPEIWRQTDGNVDAVVCGVGSGGTITGLGNFFRRTAPKVQMILADPVGSVLADIVEGKPMPEPGSWLVEGIGEDFIPPIADMSLASSAERVPDDEAFAACRTLLENEGILAGSSSGTLIAAAVRWAKRQTEKKTVVTFVCDSGNKYLSKAYNPNWLADMGMIAAEHFGDLRDLIARPASGGTLVGIEPADTLKVAYQRMRIYDVSQLPVLEDKQLVGIIDESDLLLAVRGHGDAFDRPVKDVMTERLQTLPPTASFDDLNTVLDQGFAAVIHDGQKFLGLITRVDVLNYLRKQRMLVKRS